MTCLCGNELALVLAQLGSTWCHDCRDDEERRYRVLTELKRDRSSRVTGGLAVPRGRLLPLRSRP